MSAQVDLDLLADYVGGALDGTPDEARVTSLIASSSEWRRAAHELTAALTAVSADLAAYGRVPEVMPVDLVDRFDAFLASPAMAPLVSRESAHGGRGGATDLGDTRPAGISSGDTRPPGSRRAGGRAASGRPKRWRRWAAPVAIMAAALAFFAIGNLPSLNTNSKQDGTAADAPEMASSLDRKLTTTGEPVPTITSGRQHNRSSLQGSRSTGDTVAPPPTYSAATPDRQLSTETIAELQRLTDPVALQTCLDAVAVVLPGKATLIDYAYFEGKPALVISITTFGGRWMFVAGASCGINGPDELFRTPLK